MEVNRVLLNLGYPRRVWPARTLDGYSSKLFVSVGLARLLINGSLYIFELDLDKDVIKPVSNLSKVSNLLNTSGSPLQLDSKTLLVPAWNAGFYSIGTSGVCILKSEDGGISWKVTYNDSKGTYAKHLCSDINDYGRMCIGIGIGGGGKKGIISYTPYGSYLLYSEDYGESWQILYKINYPTAIYDCALIDRIIIFTAREKKSIFISINGGRDFKEYNLGLTARNITYLKDYDLLLISNDDSIFLLRLIDNKVIISKLNLPTKGLLFVIRLGLNRKEVFM